jgi:hypothetical protein
MKVKGKRVLKNGRMAGYVYNSQTKKWKWQFISGGQKGGDNRKLRDDYILIVNAVKDFAKYLLENTKKKKKSKARHLLKLSTNKIELDQINQTTDMHSQNRTTKFSYITVTYHRFIKLLMLRDILLQYIKSKQPFKNSPNPFKKFKLPNRKKLDMNNETAFKLAQIIIDYIQFYLNTTSRARKRAAAKNLDEEDRQKYLFILSLNNIFEEKKINQLEQTIRKGLQQAQNEFNEQSAIANEQLKAMGEALNTGSAAAAAAPAVPTGRNLSTGAQFDQSGLNNIAAAANASAVEELNRQLGKVNEISNQLNSAQRGFAPASSEVNNMVQQETQIQKNELNLLKSDIFGLCKLLKQKLPPNSGNESIEKLRQACRVIIKNRSGNPVNLNKKTLENIKKALEKLMNSP